MDGLTTCLALRQDGIVVFAEVILKLPDGVQPKLAQQIAEYAKLLEMPQVFGPGTLEPAKLN